jgi:hypothetical protein
MLDFFIFFSNSLCLFYCAYRFAKSTTPTENSHYYFLTAVIGFLLLITLEVLSLGWIGILYPSYMIAVSGSILLLSIRVFKINSKPTPLFPWLRSLPLFAKIFAGFCLVVALWFCLINLLFPPHVWDVLTYHLPNVAEWVRHHRIFEITTPVARSNALPMGFEVLLAYVGVFFNDDLYLRFVETAFGLLACPVAYGIFHEIMPAARHTGMRVIMALAFFCTPAILFQLNASRNDLSINILYLFTLYFCLISWRTQSTRLMLPGGIAAGLAFGMKPTAVLSLSPILLGYTVAMVRVRGLRRTLVGALPVAGFGLLVGAPWYIKNLIVYGHPTRAISGAVGNTFVWLNTSTLAANLHDAYGKVLDNVGAFSSDTNKISGYGPFFYAFTLPLLLLVLANKFKEKNKISSQESFWWVLSIFIGAAVIILPYVTNGFEMSFRYFAWFSIFPYVLCAYFLAAEDHSLNWQTLFIPVFALGSGFSFIASYSFGELTSETLEYLASKPRNLRTSALKKKYVPTAHQYLELFLPASQYNLSAMVGKDSFIYTMYGPKFARTISHCHHARGIGEIKQCMEKNTSQLLYIENIGEKVMGEINSADSFLLLHPGLFLVAH